MSDSEFDARLDLYKDQMQEMEDWLKEVHNDVKEGKDMTMIHEMTDMGEKVCEKQMVLVKAAADDFADLNDNLDAEIAMMRQLTQFEFSPDDDDEEEKEAKAMFKPVPERILTKETQAVFDWAKKQQRQKEK